MNFKLEKGNISEIKTAFFLLSEASKSLAKKNVSQWNYWQDPPIEKIKWVEEGFLKGEFYFIKNNNNETMGMVRILNEDLTYWGKREESAKYVHSLVVHKKFAGLKLGAKVLDKIAEEAKANKVQFLRLDCDATNPQLCAYYTSKGFIKVGEVELPLSIYNLYQKEI